MDPPQNYSMHQALQNPIIVKKILENKFVSAKPARLVCHVWNEIILSLPRPKLTLRLFQEPWCRDPDYVDCCHATPFQLFCINMEPRLAKSVEEYGCLQSGDKHGPTRRISAESKLLHVSDKFSLLIEDLRITFADKAMTPTLYEILQKCCPNLKRLELCYRKKTYLEDELTPASLLPLFIRPNLTYIKIFGIVDDEHSGSPEIAQLILNSAPNVTHFVYHGKKYPDLSRNKAIKWLEVDMDCTKATSIPSCSGVHGLNKMLDQVKDQLHFFHLKSSKYMIEAEDPGYLGHLLRDEAARIGFQMPKMKNVTEFGNDMLDLFSCGDQLQDIYAARIPNLEILHISEREHNLDELLRNIAKRKDLFKRVKNLHVADVSHPDSITGLKTPFPNLESLTIVQFDKWLDSELVEVGSNLQACISLGLQSLKLELTNSNENLSEFIQGFSNCEKLFSNLKTLEIRLSSNVYDDMGRVTGGISQVKRWLLGMKQLESVTISGILFNEDTWKWVKPFIQENKIPIEFGESCVMLCF